jgi:choice-of-anchor A domain-containing protein
MKNKSFVLALSLTAMASLAQAATGDYSFNALVFNDFNSTNSSSQGSLAAGGSFGLSSYSAGVTTGSDLALYAGKNVSMSNGQVNGNIQAVGTVSLSSAGINGTTIKGASSFVPQAQAYYTSLSQIYDAMADTGQATRQSWGGITFTGTSAPIQVIDVDASLLSGANSWSFSGLASGALLVLNISGSSAAFSNLDMGVLQQFHTILNFTQASTVNFANTSPWASVLAPYADITGQNGRITGSVVASAWDSTLALSMDSNAALKVNTATFASAVPEVSTSGMLMAGLLVLVVGGYLQKRRAPARG